MNMNIQIYTLDNAPAVALRLLVRYPKIKLSTLFKRFRGYDQFSIFGDYPILFSICQTAASLGIIYGPQEIAKACKFSEELKHYRSDSFLVKSLWLEVEQKHR